MWPFKKKSKKRKCSHCMHPTDKLYKQKVRDWNKCRTEPYAWQYFQEGKCCKCDLIGYQYVAKHRIDDDNTNFPEIKIEHKVGPMFYGYSWAEEEE